MKTVIIVIVVLIVLGAGGYLVFHKNQYQIIVLDEIDRIFYMRF